MTLVFEQCRRVVCTLLRRGAMGLHLAPNVRFDIKCAEEICIVATTCEQAGMKYNQAGR